MKAASVHTTDWNAARGYGEHVHVGQGFLFLGSKAFEGPGLAWVARLFNEGRAMPPKVVSLLGPERIDLPGVQVHPAAAPQLQLRSLTTDKAIYREGQDTVRLLVLDLLAPGAERLLEVELNGREFGRYPMTLDGRGAALLELRDLPAGDYQVRVRGAGGFDATFTVAVYRLAPLVASLAQRRMDGPSRLWARLRLESYGVAVEGPVTVEITDRGSRLGRERAEARAGFVEVTLPLTGEGPHALNVQMVNDPSRTATVPIVGSRAFEREKTLFSTLEQEVWGALMPGEESRPVRGIYLEEGARRTSPFALERVDGKTARLRALTTIEAARIVVIDPAFPQPRPDAIDPTTAQHPAYEDQAYTRGEKLFQQGKYIEARALFELGLSSKPVVHPNYAYYVACCYARQGELAQAVAALRTAVEHGWRDYAHLNADDDLAALRGYGPFEALRAGGRREVSFEQVARGQQLEVEGLGPLSLLAVGAFVEGSPWEGWAALLGPEEISARVIAPELPSPGSEVRIDVEVGAAASVFVLVKDARLLSPDTPLNRLAGCLKRCVDETGKQLGRGVVARSLGSMIQAPPPGYPPPPYSTGYGPPMGAPMPGAPMMAPHMPPPAPQARMSAPAMPARPMAAQPAARPAASQAFGGAPPPPMAAPPMPAAMAAPPMPAAMAAPVAAPAFGPPPGAGGGPPPGMAPGGYGGPPAAAPMPPPPEERAPRAEAGKAADAAAEPEAAASPRPNAAIAEEPEILFAGLVEARDGQASVTVRLPPTAADYLVEVFALSGLQWKQSELRFRADKVPSVALEVPPYVHGDDAALGRMVVACASGRMRPRLLRDGVEVRLVHEGRELAPGQELRATSAELSFLALPGDHSAVIEDLGTGAADWVGKRVDEPGKFRRVARQLVLLSPGEAISRDRDRSVVGLRVLPGLDRPFSVLVEATADYGHACCEQTAAKLLAACGMYVFAEHDAYRRAQAEAIILAGVRREQGMWLRGRGFRMYPESRAEPDTYWGPKAAKYLWFLATVRDAAAAPSKVLVQALDEGLQMAADATRAYGIAWPPAAAATCEDAYQVARFGTDRGAQERALAVARRWAAQPVYPGGAVAQRVELAYAAATLLRLGSQSDWPAALALANRVTQAFGAQGRLYSTVDSVAAIALMAELRAAGIVGRGGQVRVNQQTTATNDAAQFEGEVREVAALGSVAAVEVARLVEEDWGGFQMSVPLRLSLERGGRPARKLSAGDDLTLRVTLEGGYKAGDLLWVCLPDALSRVVGGGQVKLFSVDFKGQNEVTVPLAATGVTVGRDGNPAPQRFAVCVRNMFEEERAGNPGLLDVVVEAPGDSSGLGRILRGVKALFGG